jgi:hypothetical protein
MVVSAVIPIPRTVIERLHLDLSVSENQMNLQHFFAWNAKNELAVLTFLAAYQLEWVYSLYFSEFDGNGILKRQLDLSEVSAVVWDQDKLTPAAIEFLADGCILLGASTVVASSPGKSFMSGLYVVDVERDQVLVRRPWSAARIVWTHDNYLLGTIHASFEMRHRYRLDDAVVISSTPMRRGTPLGDGANELSPMRLVAIFCPDSPAEFPEAYQSLNVNTPRKRLLRSTGLLWNWQTHLLAPMNNGNFAASVWETALHQVIRYYFAIFSREGDPLHVIEAGIEKFSQLVNDPLHGVLVHRGTSEMTIYNYQGQRMATLALDRSAASTLKNYEFRSINGQGRLLFVSPRLKQSNCFFVLDGSDNPAYRNYERIVSEGAKQHKNWLTKKKKELTPNCFRWAY